MTQENENLYSGLERIFHEPNRLAIMTALLGTDKPLSFNTLKETCNLTDGNLSRHLSTLESSGSVKIHKSFEDKKPLTTVGLTGKGRENFIGYLDALQAVLEQAEKKIKASPASGKRYAGRGKVKPANT